VDTDAALVARAKDGDAAAFGAIVESHRRRVFGLVFGITGRPDAAEELTQEAFVRLWRSLPDLDGRFPPYAWLRRTATNLAIDYCNGERRAAAARPRLAARAADRPAEKPDRTLAGREDLDRVRAAMDRLPADQRTALTLRVVEGLSYQQIAETMGCAPGTVMSRLARARVALREILEQL
jgi:RNA polymerase sigma-70 factor (ECF subfamily)